MLEPDFETFYQHYATGRTVRVHSCYLSDTMTPISAFQRLQHGPFSCLLESVTGGEYVGRYSFVASSPIGRFRASGNHVEIERDGESRSFESEDPLADLWDLTQEYVPMVEDDLPRLAGGAVGYMSYDSIRYIERLPDVPNDDLGLPDLYFCIYDTMLIFDNVDKTMRIVTNVFPGEATAEEAYESAKSKIAEVEAKLAAETPAPLLPIQKSGDTNLDHESSFEPQDFMDSVDKCKEYIRAGDVFQVVISQRFHVRTKAPPFDIYRSLRSVNPSPYMYYLTFDDLYIVGASPEVMCRVDDGQVHVRPIAGTRRRGRTEEEEKQMGEELLNDPKEIAEHVMLLDLGRNDVGRISEFNSVKITDKMVLEKYSHVMHMTSHVVGKLENGRNSMDAFRACFPAGTVSGAPKIRAMEIIDEIEPTKRGPYAGAVGYFDFAGNMDTAITLRTLVIKGEDAYAQAGAGVVADSVPELEHKECQNKARALLKAIDVAEQHLM
ncbi:MAG: anthranilate synthase component I [Planctomycetota bacterium]|nr:anthranilate synthase component I [Planctomycetota bacterium]